MQINKTVLDVCDKNATILGSLTFTRHDTSSGVPKLPNDDCINGLRQKTSNSLVSLANKITDDAKSRTIILIGVMRGGIITAELLYIVLNNKNVFNKLVLLPTFRSDVKAGNSIISQASLKLFNNIYKGDEALYLVDGWTGTGESLEMIEASMREFLPTSAHIKTTALLDIHKSVDLYGNDDDFLIPNSLNYHSGLAMKASTPDTPTALPIVEVGSLNLNTNEEIRRTLSLLESYHQVNTLSKTPKRIAYDESTLALLRAKRIGLGINEALHRYYRENQTICIPKKLWTNQLKSLVFSAGIRNFKIIDTSIIKHVFSIKAELLQQPFAFS